jgi:hypothetical protein
MAHVRSLRSPLSPDEFDPYNIAGRRAGLATTRGTKGVVSGIGLGSPREASKLPSSLFKLPSPKENSILLFDKTPKKGKKPALVNKWVDLSKERKILYGGMGNISGHSYYIEISKVK